METRPGSLGLSVAGVVAFLFGATLHLTLGYVLRFAYLKTDELAMSPFVALPGALAAGLAVEWALRGRLYPALRAKLPVGFAAPVVAVLGGIALSILRVELLVHPDVPILLLYVQGFVVEALLGLGLCWIALGTGSWIPGGVALGLLWALRLSTIVVFHGAVLPVFEMIAAAAAGGFAALALYKPLRPHRELLMGIAE